MLKRMCAYLLAIVIVFSGFSALVPFFVEITQATDINGGHITSDTTWTLADSPFLINGDVVVDYGVTLTIEPGVEVRFKDKYNIYVEGNLTAVGDSANHIVFTSNKGNKKEGDWKTIRINATGILRMNYCDVSYGNNAIQTFGSGQTVIENSTVSYSKRHGIYVRYSSSIEIKNCDIGPNNWNGIYFYSSSDSNVVNSIVHINSFQGISISDSDFITITNSEFYGNEVNGIHLFQSSNVTITNSKSYQNSNMGVVFAHSQDNVLENCDIYENTEDGIYLPESSDNLIDGCTIFDHQNGIYLFNSSSTIIRDSEIHTNKFSGITFIDSSHNTVDTCNIYSSGSSGIYATKDPLHKAGSPFITITDVEIWDNLYGVLMRFSPSSSITGSHIHTNTNGISIQEGDGFSVSNNNVSHNKYYGLYFIGSSNGFITNNDLLSNYYGIFLLAPSNNNLIHHNTVKEHVYYAYGTSITNQWDDGSEGNYWGDYDHVDLDGNGIGDAPYPINSMGEDRYPLVDFNNTRFKVLNPIPANESTIVPVGISIKFFLSESAIPETFEGNITVWPTTPILGYTWEDSNKNLTLTLPALIEGEYYIVTVKTNATGTSGRSLLKSYILVFYTENPSDSTPPQVTDVNPTGNTVPVNITTINITFSEVMIRSATEPSFSIEPWVPGDITWDNTTLSFHPDWDLQELTQYTVRLDGSMAKDAVGFYLDGDSDGTAEGSPTDDYIWQFTTQRLDYTPPTILNVEPTGSMVDANASIKIYFSELMNKTTVENAFSFANGTVTWTSANGTWGRSAYIMTYIPDEPFNFLQDYTVTIKGTAEDWHTNMLDGDGNGTAMGSPADDYTWSFSTIYDPAIGLPTVLNILPTGTEIPIDTEVTINFSQTMNQGSVEDAFTITDGTSTWDRDDGTFVWSGNSCTFIPGFPLNYGGVYTVEVNTSATNFVGYQLDGNANLIPEDYTLDAYSWTFATEAPAELVFSSITVNGQDAANESLIWYADAGEIVLIGVNIKNTGFDATQASFNVSLHNQSGSGDPIILTYGPLLLGEESATQYFLWDAPVALGDHFVEIIVDEEGVIKEVNEGNNTHVLHFAVGPDYMPVNVTVDGMDASDPSDVWYVDIGEPVEIGMEVKNAGFSGVSPGITYSIVFWNATSAGALLGPSSFNLVSGLPGLSAGESSQAHLTDWYAPNQAGDFYIAILIDYDDTTLEIDESNNVFLIHVATAPDYTVANVLVDGSDADNPNLEWEQSAGDLVAISVNATNIGLSGAADSVPYFMSFYNSTAWGDPIDTPFYTAILPGLSSGEDSGAVVGTWPAPNLAGDQYVVVIVDAGDDLQETDEDNNDFVLHFKIGPDIRPTAVFVNGQEITKSPSFPIYVGPGETVNIDANATNFGFSATGMDFKLALYNGTWNGALLVAPYLNLTVPSLAEFGSPGSDSGQISMYWDASYNAGLHYVVVYLDMADDVSESNENNNFWVLTFLISPDLVPANVTVDGLPVSSYPDETVTMLPGQSITLGAQALNTGQSSTGIVQFSLAYYNATSSGANLGPPYNYTGLLGPLGASGATPDIYSTWTAPFPNTPTSYYINISVDSDNALSEDDEANNYFLLHIVVDAPDLTPDRISVEAVVGGQYFITDNPQAGGFVSGEIPVPIDVDLVIMFDVMNAGGVDQIAGTNVTFYNTTFLLGPQNATPFYETISSWVLLGGRSSPTWDQTSEVGQTIYTVWPNPGAYGLWYINITINPQGSMPEFNSGNNTFTLILNVTDFPVTSLNAVDPSYSGAALYVNSTSSLNFTASGENPPFFTWYRITDIDNGIVVKDWTNYTAEGTNFSMLWGEGAFEIEFNSTDAVFKDELVRSRIVIVDDSLPETSLDIGTPQFHTLPSDAMNVTSATPLTFSVEDFPSGDSIAVPGIPNASGVAGIHYRIQNVSSGLYVRGWTLQSQGIPFYLNDPLWGDGYYIIWYNTTDNLNQKEMTKNVTLYLDNSGPSTIITIGQPNWTVAPQDRVNVTSTTPFYIQSMEIEGSLSDTDSIEFLVTNTDQGVDSGWMAGDTFDISGAFYLGDGNYTIEARSRDNLGNIMGSSILLIYVDDSPPSLSLAIGNPKYREIPADGYNISYSTQISVAATDGSGSGVSIMEYRILSTGYDSGWLTYTVPFNLSGLDEGSYTIWYRATDNLGNVRTQSEQIYLDIISPETAIDLGVPKHRAGSPNIWNITSSTPIILDVVFENGSGLLSLEYRITNLTYDSGWRLYSDEFYINALFTPGEYTIIFRSTDNIGNMETEKSVVVRLDNSEPTSSISISGMFHWDSFNDVWYVSTLNVFYKNADDGPGSGIGTIWHRIYGNDTGFYYTGWLSTATFHLDLPDGRYTIEHYAVDNLSNAGVINFRYIYLDNSPPASQITIGDPKYRLRPTDDWQVSTETLFSLLADDGSGSGVEHIFYSIWNTEGTLVVSSAEYSQPFNISGLGKDGLYTLRFWSDDSVGNCEESNEITVILDSTLPSIAFTAPKGTGNSISSFFEVIFSEDMDHDAVEGAFSYTDGTDTWDSSDGFFNWDGSTMTFFPYENLSYATHYTVTILHLASDNVGNRLDSDGNGVYEGIQETYSWQFWTIERPDSEPPQVTDVHPGDFEQGIVLDSVISMTFSETMNELTVEEAFSYTDDTTVFGPSHGTFTWNGNTTIFTPHTSFSFDTGYTVTLSSLASDINGNPLPTDFSWSFRTQIDSIPPEIIGTLPQGDNVSVATEVSITFDEAMDKSSVEEAFILTPHINGTFRWQGNTVTFTPSTSLLFGTEYYVTVGIEVKDLLGNALDFPYQFSFTTEPDVTPPEVSDHSPVGSDLLLDIIISITFNEPMDKESVEAAFEISPSAQGTFSWDKNTLMFTPTDLQAGTTYTITISGARDAAGNILETPYQFTFTTKADPYAPLITGVEPSGEEVPLDAVIEVTFNEPMDNASLYGAFEITPYVPGTFTWEGNTLIFTPNGKLETDTTYNVTILGTALDLSENPMGADYSWEFTTELEEVTEGEQFPWEIWLAIIFLIIFIIFILFLIRELRSHWLRKEEVPGDEQKEGSEDDSEAEPEEESQEKPEPEDEETEL